MSLGIVKSFKVGSTLSSQRIVTHTTGTADVVKAPAGALELPVGITLDTVLDTTSSIPVKVAGIAELFFNDTVTSGALVAADSSGRGIPFVDATAGATFVGTLIDATIGQTGTIAKVLINPGFKAIP